jgi:3-hydroxyisobutyrate dehydrogenase-like beta-hydroxyacid dehydrogenase
MNRNIGIIGLGRCGMPAAQRFLENGYRVFGYARRAEVIEKFEGFGGSHRQNPAEVARYAETVIVMVLNDEQVLEVITSPQGILAGASSGSTVICMSTINRANLEWVAGECAKRQVRFVDCPFTGGPARVTAGTLTLIAAAPSAVLESCRPVLEVLGKITVAGEQPGTAQAIKHCNQLLVTVIHAATIELITLAEKSGIDPRVVCEVVGNGIAGNDYFRLLSRAILDHTGSPGGTGQLWKDVNIVVNSARIRNLPLLVATAASHYFNIAKTLGMEQEDSARMMEVMRRMTEKDIC